MSDRAPDRKTPPRTKGKVARSLFLLVKVVEVQVETGDLFLQLVELIHAELRAQLTQVGAH